jgi:hypothetical protein
MKKIKKALAVAVLVGAVGVSYALFTLRGMPETFDWENEDDE